MSRWVSAALGLLLAACSSVSPDKAPDVSCREQFQAHVDAAKSAGRLDAEAQIVAGHPHLRVNRLLVALAQDLSTPQKQEAWYDRARALAAAAEKSEHASHLPVNGCETDILSAANAARVDSVYNDFQRLVGLYPLTSLGAHLGYERWKKDHLSSFQQAPDRLPVQGRLVRYGMTATLSLAQAEALVASAPRDALGLISLDVMKIAAAYAPVFQVDQASAADRVGSLVWQNEDRLAVETNEPVVYVRLTHTLVKGVPHPQLVYSISFPERPAMSTFDLLAGDLDALVWRITLNQQGKILVHDTIHACGCYHLFFPTRRVARKSLPEDDDIRETIETPKIAPSGRLAVHLAATNHYVRGIDATDSGFDTRLAPLADRVLTRLPTPKGPSKSVFGSDGIIDQSARLERWILWPMGISSAGAMRQWGRQATAFVGKRHFDDPKLFDRAFRSAQ